MEERPDAFHGVGGSYIIDPETGQRKLTETSDEQPKEQEQPAQLDKCHGVGGSYMIDPETGKTRPHTGREHLLIKPGRPAEPAEQETKQESGASETFAPETNREQDRVEFPARKRKSKRGDK